MKSGNLEDKLYHEKEAHYLHCTSYHSVLSFFRISPSLSLSLSLQQSCEIQYFHIFSISSRGHIIYCNDMHISHAFNNVSPDNDIRSVGTHTYIIYIYTH